MATTRVEVKLAERSYEVVIGSGAAQQIDDFVPRGANRVVVITEKGLPFECIPSRTVETIRLDRGEDSKSLSVAEGIWRRLAQIGLTRNDLIVAVGGGMITDVAGFVAACWHRGTPFVNVPTTLLGMVDAAVGGKTAVNIPEGKNLVGSFWQPSAVLADTNALRTLPDREMRCGLGEIAKYHFITGDDMLSLSLEGRIARCVRIKADIVSQDEREGGRRALLNYGHTLGHAIENVGRHQLAHGEGVAIGILFAARLAHALGRISEDRVRQHHLVVEGEYGLASGAQRDHVRELSLDALMDAMSRDKKALDGLTFVLDGSTGLDVVTQIDPNTVREVLANFLAR